VAGSLTLFLGGWLLSTGIIWFFLTCDVFSIEIEECFNENTVIAMDEVLIESINVHKVDNLTTPAATTLAGYLYF